MMELKLLPVVMTMESTYGDEEFCTFTPEVWVTVVPVPLKPPFWDATIPTPTPASTLATIRPMTMNADKPWAIVRPPLSFHLRCSNRARSESFRSGVHVEEPEPLVAVVLEEAFVSGGALRPFLLRHLLPSLHARLEPGAGENLPRRVDLEPRRTVLAENPLNLLHKFHKR